MNYGKFTNVQKYRSLIRDWVTIMCLQLGTPNIKYININSVCYILPMIRESRVTQGEVINKKWDVCISRGPL